MAESFLNLRQFRKIDPSGAKILPLAHPKQSSPGRVIHSREDHEYTLSIGSGAIVAGREQENSTHSILLGTGLPNPPKPASAGLRHGTEASGVGNRDSPRPGATEFPRQSLTVPL